MKKNMKIRIIKIQKKNTVKNLKKTTIIKNKQNNNKIIKIKLKKMNIKMNLNNSKMYNKKLKMKKINKKTLLVMHNK